MYNQLYPGRSISPAGSREPPETASPPMSRRRRRASHCPITWQAIWSQPRLAVDRISATIAAQSAVAIVADLA
jgi:hypothetical protein